MRKHRVDLHNHTPLIPNDYRGPLTTSGEDIVKAAIDAGIDVLAISDHFAIDFFQTVRSAADEVRMATDHQLLVVPGSELKITWMGEEVHLIVLFEPERAEEQFKELMGFLGVSDSDRVIERLPIITVNIDPVVVAQKVRSMGGMCHLGHVDRFFGDYRLIDRPIIDRLIREAPIAAVELVDSANSEPLRRKTNGIPHIQSSDSHSTREIGRRYAEVYMQDLTFESLKDALQATGH